MICKLIIHGAAGAMGHVLGAMAVKQKDRFQIVAGVDRAAVAPGEFEYPVYPSFDKCQEPCDVIIDFSVPVALEGVIAAAKARGCALVVATTGMEEKHERMMREASAFIPVFVAANMSIGVNLQKDLVKRAASFLGDNFDIEIVEKHHNQKIDAPSGTAMMLAKAINAEFAEGKDFIYDRHLTRAKRSKREIGLHAIRGGTIKGEHEVHFIGEDEVIEINHRAQSKNIFAAGALRAAAYIVGCEPKLYSWDEIGTQQHAVTNVDTYSCQAVVSTSSQSADELYDAFEAVSKNGVNIDMVSRAYTPSGVSNLSYSVCEGSLDKIRDILEGRVEFTTVGGVVKVAIEGLGMEHKPGIAAAVLRILREAGAEIYLISTSEIQISCCVDAPHASDAASALMREFGL